MRSPCKKLGDLNSYFGWGAPLNFQPNQPKNGGKLTGMDVGEFSIYHAYLFTVFICLIAITMVGGGGWGK